MLDGRGGEALSYPAMIQHVAVLALLLLALLCTAARAETPTERLRELFDEANRILTAPEARKDPVGALGRVRARVAGVFEFRGAAEQALGREWAARSRTEREEFVRLFADLLDRNLVARIAMKARLADGRLTIRFLDETIDGDTTTLRAAVEARDGHELSLAYRMVRDPRGWKVRDVVMDGVSVVANYQAQVARVLRMGSFEALLAQMRSKASPEGVVLAALAEGKREEGFSYVEPVAAVARTPPVEVVTATRQAADVAPLQRRSLVATVSKAEPPPPRAANRPMATRVSYWVQLGAFKTAAEATRFAARVRDPKLTIESAPGRPLLVLVGPFDDRAAAATKVRELRARGYAPFSAEARN